MSMPVGAGPVPGVTVGARVTGVPVRVPGLVSVPLTVLVGEVVVVVVGAVVVVVVVVGAGPACCAVPSGIVVTGTS
jgi:hypothetical protein